MKSKLIIILLFCSLIILSGCTKKEEISINIKESSKTLTDKLTFSETLTVVDSKTTFTLFKIDDTIIKDSIVLISSGATAEEIAIFEVKDKKDIGSAKQACLRRLETKRNDFKDYIPKEIVKIENATIYTKGNYVILVIAKENKGVLKQIEALF